MGSLSVLQVERQVRKMGLNVLTARVWSKARRDRSFSVGSMKLG
jgi:hypothetical protein